MESSPSLFVTAQSFDCQVPFRRFILRNALVFGGFTLFFSSILFFRRKSFSPLFSPLISTFHSVFEPSSPSPSSSLSPSPTTSFSSSSSSSFSIPPPSEVSFFTHFQSYAPLFALGSELTLLAAATTLSAALTAVCWRAFSLPKTHVRFYSPHCPSRYPTEDQWADIEAEFAFSASIVHDGLALGPTYLIHVDGRPFITVVALSEVCWAYLLRDDSPQVFALIFLASGTELVFPLQDESNSGTWISAVKQRAPWVIVGFSDELEEMWRQKRDSFVIAVQQRKSL